jgi:4-amino-4-deoxy-L-arabinose transferase-like glycosyltransferase
MLKPGLSNLPGMTPASKAAPAVSASPRLAVVEPGATGRELARVLFIVGAALAVRLFFLAVSDNAEADSFARVLLARRVIDDWTLVPSATWLPGHLWILAFPYGLGLSDQLWPRLLTALFGTATVALTYLLGKELFGRRGGLVSATLLAFNPLHVRLSVVSMSETMFLAFLALALWQYLAYLKDGGPRALAVGALAMNLACAHRMEGWLVLPLLLAYAPLRFLAGEAPLMWPAACTTRI